MALIGSERSETNLNYNWQTFANSFNRAFSSSTAFDASGNTTVNLGAGAGASAGTLTDLVPAAVAGLLVIAGAAILLKGGRS